MRGWPSGTARIYHPDRKGSPAFVNVDGSLNATNWDDMLETLGTRFAGKKIAIFKGGRRVANNFYRGRPKKMGRVRSGFYLLTNQILFMNL